MTQNSEEADEQSVTQEEVALAESQEQNELNAAQKAYLQRRVVTLRVQNNRLQRELTAAQTELARVIEQHKPEEGATDEFGPPPPTD